MNYEKTVVTKQYDIFISASHIRFSVLHTKYPFAGEFWEFGRPLLGGVRLALSGKA
jgi:hypothetical protein